MIKILIDQGHNPGTINAGASANGLVESELTYQAGIYLKELLETNCDFEVRLTRNTPLEVLGYDIRSSLQERVQMANDWPADYFISIHVNSNPNPAINGTEVYVYSLESTAAELAHEELDSIVAFVGTKDNLVRANPSLYVLRRTAMPAILVELAYLSNPQDAVKLKNEQFRFAFAMYIGLLNYFNLPYEL